MKHLKHISLSAFCLVAMFLSSKCIAAGITLYYDNMDNFNSNYYWDTDTFYAHSVVPHNYLSPSNSEVFQNMASGSPNTFRISRDISSSYDAYRWTTNIWRDNFSNRPPSILYFDYYNGTWNTISSVPLGVDSAYVSYGPFDLPSGCSKVRLRVYASNTGSTVYIDDDSVQADMRPTLSWSGEANYTTDGLYPDVATISQQYTWRIKYTDSDNDAPTYMRVHILKGGSEISGSPFDMGLQSGAYNSGAIFSYTRRLDSGNDYTYYFDTSDGWLSATSSVYSGPNVENLLSWTGEAGYEVSGVAPLIGGAESSFIFRAKYTNAANAAPSAGFPRVNVLKNGATTYTIPMNPEGSNYVAGVMYSTHTLLAPCSYYIYNIEASDNRYPDFRETIYAGGPNVGYKVSGFVVQNDIAPISSATVKAVGYTTYYCQTNSSGYYEMYLPCNNDWVVSVSSLAEIGTVSFTPSSFSYPAISVNKTAVNFVRNDNNPLLVWAGDSSDYIADGVYPKIGASTTTYTFRVKYTDVENDPPMTGYPKVRIKKDGQTIQLISMSYVNGDFTAGVISSTSVLLPPATYTYCFEARDIYGAWDVTGVPISDKAGPDVKAQISGVISSYFGAPIVGHKVNLFGQSYSTVAYTGSSGDFQFPMLDTSRNYTVFPESWTSCYFDMPSINISPLQANATLQFLQMNDVKLVSGRVDDPKGNGISGITTSLTGTHTNSCVTGNSGDFQLYVTTEPYSIALVHPYYLFTPSSYTLSGISSPLNNLNFVRLNRNPVLLVTGETGYTADATEPDTGAINQNISFRIKYKDDDNDGPKTNCPLVSIMKDGTTVQTLSLSYQSGAVMSGAIYGGSVSFNKSGEYSYSISANDVYDAPQNVMYCGTFQIQSQKPNAPQINTLEIRDGETVTSGKIHLCWNCEAIGNDDLTYTLYLSVPQTPHNGSGYFAPNSSLSAVYVGKEREYTLTSLDQDRTYYWKIRAENQYGAYAESPMYSFSTLGAIKKSFNYPNPFSPPNQHTNFVIDMSEPGSVEITIYSEYGDRMWRQSFNDLPKGQNQISYNGTDDNGKVLYNGTAVAIIKKHYGPREEQDHVRILIIK